MDLLSAGAIIPPNPHRQLIFCIGKGKVFSFYGNTDT
jgi:hypothetical protein